MFPWLRYITSPRFVMYLHLIPSLQKVSTYMACYSHTAPPSNVSAVVKAIAGGSCTAGKLSTCARRVPGSAELLANHFCARIKAVRSSTVGFAQIIALLSLDSLPRLGKGPRYFCLPLLVWRQILYVPFAVSYRGKQVKRRWTNLANTLPGVDPKFHFFLCSQLCTTVGTPHVSRLKQRNKRGI